MARPRRLSPGIGLVISVSPPRPGEKIASSIWSLLHRLQLQNEDARPGLWSPLGDLGCVVCLIGSLVQAVTRRSVQRRTQGGGGTGGRGQFQN